MPLQIWAGYDQDLELKILFASKVLIPIFHWDELELQNSQIGDKHHRCCLHEYKLVHNFQEYLRFYVRKNEFRLGLSLIFLTHRKQMIKKSLLGPNDSYFDVWYEYGVDFYIRRTISFCVKICKSIHWFVFWLTLWIALLPLCLFVW